MRMLPCVIFEDDHLLVVNKPAGMNTHRPDTFAGEGLYDWLRAREPRWASLAIIHRLDKETSGVLVFGKTPLANRSLTEQFTAHVIRKKYLLLTDRPAPELPLTVKTALVRSGDKYLNRPLHGGADIAETRFIPQNQNKSGPPHPPSSTKRDYGGTGGGCYNLIEAEPVTGRTHQIRAQAAHGGFPILGDTLYGGTPASRVFLHAAELVLKHPANGEVMTFRVPTDFDADPRPALRTALIEADATNAYRLIHGAADGWPGWYMERLGDHLLSQGESALTDKQQAELQRLVQSLPAHGAYHKILTRQVRRTTASESSPQLAIGRAAPGPFAILENGVQFELSFGEGYSTGLFLDQRDNRRRLLTGYVAPDFVLPRKDAQVLNAFAYTCGFSVCVARSGAKVTSLDLSKKYLEWGRRNFALNGLDPAAHDFIYGDAFDWLRRLAKKGRAFDVVVLDPPTFSQSKESGVFRAEKDYGKLVAASLPLLKPDGVLLASSNAAEWLPEKFVADVEGAVASSGRKVVQRHYSPQPPDFPINRAEPAYLKTIWLRIR